MLETSEVPDAVRECLEDFFRSLNRDVPDFNDGTDLITGTGACSDEGVDFAIDLQDKLGVDVPNDFNPFVHESGRRGMRYGELVERAQRFVAAAKEAHNV